MWRTTFGTSPFIERPVPKFICCVVLSVFVLQPCAVARGQEPASAKPGPEFTETAGSSFNVEVQLLAPLTQRMAIYANYVRIKAEKDGPDEGFNCYGEASNVQNPVVVCSIPVDTHGGVYQGTGTITLRRIDTGKQRDYKDIRLPIVTVLSNPLGFDDFPQIVGTALSLSNRQALMDGSRRSQDILNSLSTYVTANTPDSKEVRAHLRDVAEDERRVLNLTRIRYMIDPARGIANKTPPPIFFEDFDRRLRQVIRELGGKPLEHAALNETFRAHLVLAQMPHTTETVTASDKPASVNGVALKLAEILLDATKGLFGMSDSGTVNFHWSAVTLPPGADIYISRLDEPETKLAGQTDVKDATLEYARWSFRFVWNGCSSVPQTPNPYLEHRIDLVVEKVGCKPK